MRGKERDEKRRGTGEFFALLFTSHRSPLSERLEQANSLTVAVSFLSGNNISLICNPEKF